MSSRTGRIAAGIVGAALAVGGAAAVSARTSLGVFGQWGAFADSAKGGCYAIATASPEPRQRERQPYMTVATWPRSGINGQLYWLFGRTPGPGGVVAQIGGESFRLRVRGAGGWAQDAGMDAAIKARMRSTRTLSLIYRDRAGRRFSDRYPLEGAATAMDAATLACARRP